MSSVNSEIIQKFLTWEKSTRDTIDFKKIYVDIADGDIICGLVLSELVYWYLPDKSGKSNKLRVKRNDIEWIVCTREDWWERARITKDQIDRALKKLILLKLIFKESHFFSKKRQLHLRINWDTFYLLWSSYLNHPVINPYTEKNTEKSKSVNDDLLKVNSGNPILLDEYIRETRTPNTEITYSENTNYRASEKDAQLNQKTRKPNLFYDAILEVWGYTGSLNGEIQKMLMGKSEKKGFKEGNLKQAIEPAELLAWAEWYREEKLDDNDEMHMLEDRMKIQSSVAEWMRLGKPGFNPIANDPIAPTQNFNGKEMNYSVLLSRFRVDVTAKEDAGAYRDRLVSPDLWEWLSEVGYTQEEIDQIKESK